MNLPTCISIRFSIWPWHGSISHCTSSTSSTPTTPLLFCDLLLHIYMYPPCIGGRGGRPPHPPRLPLRAVRAPILLVRNGGARVQAPVHVRGDPLRGGRHDHPQPVYI